MLTHDNLQSVRAVVAGQLPAASNSAARDRANRFLDSRVIASASFKEIPFKDGAVWSTSTSRSQQRYIHGLLFLVDWYKTVLTDESTRSSGVVAAWEIVESWSVSNKDKSASPSMAYHDETTAQRLINLVSLSPYIDELLPVRTSALSALMGSTADLLSTDDFHATGNNHGMFQDLALLYWATLRAADDDPRGAAYFAKAMARLRAYFGDCFTTEGVHVENTPTYHLMVARQVDNVRKIAEAAGHPDALYYGALLKHAEKYATHALMPNATYPPISDTQQINVGQSGMDRVFTGSEFAYAISQGADGVKPTDRTLILPSSGYAIYRSQWGDPKATFAFFSAAYNADYHKHSDDLSLFLSSGGIELLSESGPYSYDYANPFSRYAYSQFAHNSLVVDGQSLPRTDGHRGKVSLDVLERRIDGFKVIGKNARHNDVVHERELDISEASGIPRFLLTDTISSSSDHEYQLLWNLGTEVSVVLHSQGFELFHGEIKVLDLVVSGNVATRQILHEGRMKPRPLGWRFPRFGEAVPAKVVAISFKGRNAQIKTDIRLADFSYKEYEISRVEKTTIQLSVNAPERSRLAYKVFRGGELVAQEHYSEKTSVRFNQLQPGRYRVRVYVRRPGHKTASPFTTRWITID
ncbi:heparinase II/III family protein [Arthrobacter sp. Sr33]